MLQDQQRDIKARPLRNEHGGILPIILVFIGLITFSTITLSTMLQRDVRLVRGIKDREQARYMAEAGINEALARIKQNGFSSRSDFTGTMDTGSYSVTYSESAGRYLVTSVGNVGGITETVSAELGDNMPTALNYFSGAGNDIRINSLVADAEIIGDIHANNDVYLKSGPFIAWLEITGDVSACGIVKEGTSYDDGGGWDIWDNHVVINGMSNDTATVFEGADRITFPTFNYSQYRDEAVDSGDYYSSDTTFSGESLSPGNGIVFVDGDARFEGPCSIDGGIVADSITVIGTLTQNKAGNRNVILTRSGDIRIFGRLYTEEALVYSAQDIITLEILADIEINGIMLAGRDVIIWNFIALIDYNYVYLAPSDMMGEDGEVTFKLVSWNE